MPSKKYKRALRGKKSNHQLETQPGEQHHDSFFSPSHASGHALPEAARSFFEPRFGENFSAVRVHHGEEAARSAQSVDARAYTTGKDIVFNEGQYAPDTPSGRKLLAHELTHVVQQQMDGEMIQRSPLPADMKLPCETEDAVYEEQDIDGIRILIGVSKKARKALKSIKDIATAITIANKTISNPDFQVKICLIAPSDTQFVHFKGEPALILHPDHADAQTARHEMGHAVFDFLSHNNDIKIDPDTKSADWIAGLTDIFLQLSQITLNKGKKNEITANWMVDPSEWSRGAADEHPINVDEFFASATAAYRTNKDALKKTIEKYAKQDAAVGKLGQQLIDMLDLLYEGKGKAVKPRTAGDKAITGELGRVKTASKVEEIVTLPQSYVIAKLLDPEQRVDCKSPPVSKTPPSKTPPSKTPPSKPPPSETPAAKSPAPTTEVPKK